MQYKLFAVFLIAVVMVFYHEPATAVNVSFVTFNTNLYKPYHSYVDERKTAVFDNLDTLQDDVICLQGINRVADQRQIITRFAARNYNYLSYVDNSLPAVPNPRACAAFNASDLGVCVLNASPTCTNTYANLPTTLDIDTASTCIFLSCIGKALPLSSDSNQPCAVCIIEQSLLLGSGAFNACNTDATNRWEANYQVLLLSKYPLKNTQKFLLSDKTQAMLYAEVDTPAGTVSVGCTSVAGSTKSNDNSALNARQLGNLTSLLTSSSGSKPRVLLGDFQAGPSSANVGLAADLFGSVQGNNYLTAFPTADWKNYYFDSTANPNTGCNLCKGNTVNLANHYPYNDSVVSHILFNGASSLVKKATVSRVFTNNVSSTIALSSQYGVRVTVDVSSAFGLIPNVCGVVMVMICFVAFGVFQ